MLSLWFTALATNSYSSYATVGLILRIDLNIFIKMSLKSMKKVRLQLISCQLHLVTTCQDVEAVCSMDQGGPAGWLYPWVSPASRVKTIKFHTGLKAAMFLLLTFFLLLQEKRQNHLNTLWTLTWLFFLWMTKVPPIQGDLCPCRPVPPLLLTLFTLPLTQRSDYLGNQCARV